MRAAVLGAGTWGTTFAKVLADAGTDVTLWARRAELAEQISERHVNPDYLPGINLPEALRATHDARAALDGAEIVAIAIPSQSLRDNLTQWAGLLPSDAVLVSLMKGGQLGTTKRMSEVIVEVTSADPGRVAVVTGPNLARQIGSGHHGDAPRVGRGDLDDDLAHSLGGAELATLHQTDQHRVGRQQARPLREVVAQ